MFALLILGTVAGAAFYLNAEKGDGDDTEQGSFMNQDPEDENHQDPEDE